MILPTKHLPLERTLLAAGAEILTRLDRPSTVSAVWDDLRDSIAFPTFDHLVLSLDTLFALGVIELHEGRLMRRDPK